MKVSTCKERQILSPCGLENFDYQVDPYIGCEHYCYYCYALAQAETDWSKEVLIYKDIVGQLGEEIDKIPPQKIYIGYYCDPYQPCETEYFQTREILELFLNRGFSASILTKSDLVVRDIDILTQMENASVSVSVAFNDNRTRELFEDNTVETEKRIDALRQLKEAGVATGALICPVIPYITDAFPLIELLEPYTNLIWIYGLSIDDRSGRNWQNVEKILNRNFPDLAGRIVPPVFSGEHAFWNELREDLQVLNKKRRLNLNIRL